MKIQTVASLQETIAMIHPIDANILSKCRAHLDTLTKPLGSLGRLEEIAAQIVAIYMGQVNLPLKKSVFVFASDHGITDEGVSAYPKTVTAQMVMNFVGGGAGINVLCRTHGVELSVVDVGVDAVFKETQGLLVRNVRRGTRNMLHEAAMSEEELHRALDVGLEMAALAQEQGFNLVAVGEMGIGNTTAASAITAIFTGKQVADVTGRGTGLTSSTLQQKIAILEAILAKQFGGREVTFDPLEVLRRVGGLELAAIVGFLLGAARRRIPVVLDGFITTSAAMVAYAIEPKMKDYLFAGHLSAEPGHRYLLEQIGLKPILSLDMRLGEGTGAVLAVPVIESAIHLYHEMATFTSAGVSTATR